MSSFSFTPSLSVCHTLSSKFSLYLLLALSLSLSLPVSLSLSAFFFSLHFLLWISNHDPSVLQRKLHLLRPTNVVSDSASILSLSPSLTLPLSHSLSLPLPLPLSYSIYLSLHPPLSLSLHPSLSLSLHPP